MLAAPGGIPVDPEVVGADLLLLVLVALMSVPVLLSGRRINRLEGGIAVALYLVYVGWLIGSGAVTVGPHDQVTGKNAQPGRIIWNIESTDVRADFDRLVAAGAIVVREPYGLEEEPDGLIATFADPDGNYFQLMSPMPAEPPTSS